MYLGVKGARAILKILNQKLELKLELKYLDKEIKEIETEMMRRTEGLTEVSKKTAIKKLKGRRCNY